MKFPRKFETNRLLLNATTEEDASFILELLNSPNWLKYIGDRKVKTKEEARQYVKNRILPQLDKMGFGNYTIILKNKGLKIGTCGLYDREGLEGFDIGFALLPGFEGQGYGYESAKLLMKLAYERFGIEKIQAITTENNLASRKLIKKLGFTFKEKIFLPGDPEELLLYIKNFL